MSSSVFRGIPDRLAGYFCEFGEKISKQIPEGFFFKFVCEFEEYFSLTIPEEASQK